MSRPRKLAAILAADIVGYSRLTDEDEDRTLARLRALRSDLLDPTVDVHGGRVVKRIGDGIIVEFRSVVDAVRSALEIQNSMTERNAGLPQERRIEFRIGIHVGDVVEEFDGDLMGEGVNIAARLEGVAKAGLIYLSEDAYRQVRSRLDVAVNDLGPIKLKNISISRAHLCIAGRRCDRSETGRFDARCLAGFQAVNRRVALAHWDSPGRPRRRRRDHRHRLDVGDRIRYPGLRRRVVPMRPTRHSPLYRRIPWRREQK